MIVHSSKVRVDYTGSVETDLLDDGIGLAGVLVQRSTRDDQYLRAMALACNTCSNHVRCSADVISRAVEGQRNGIAIEPILEVAVA